MPGGRRVGEAVVGRAVSRASLAGETLSMYLYIAKYVIAVTHRTCGRIFGLSVENFAEFALSFRSENLLSHKWKHTGSAIVLVVLSGGAKVYFFILFILTATLKGGVGAHQFWACQM